MALGLTVASDIVSMALTMYVRGKVFAQTVQDKPLVRILQAKKKTFPGGKDNVSLPVQINFMSGVSGFFQGFAEDDALVFTQAQNALRGTYPWKEMHAGLILTETELKKDGITVTDNQKTSEHSEVELTRLTSILQNRLEDFGESWARSMNSMLWGDGSQDAKQIPGVRSLMFDDSTVGTVGGLSNVTYPAWRNRSSLNITASEENQTLSKTLRGELRQLKRFGGKPNIALAGSAFIEALESELQSKGLYSYEGFVNNGKTDLGIADISLRGLGTFTYDPTLDDMGMSKKCYIFDDSKLTLYPMQDEENKLREPVRPYQYLVYMRSMTYTGALCARQRNCSGVYSIA
jgi:hypothetical protein